MDITVKNITASVHLAIDPTVAPLTLSSTCDLVLSTTYDKKDEVYVRPEQASVRFSHNEIIEIDIIGPMVYRGDQRDVSAYAHYNDPYEINSIADPAIIEIMNAARRAIGIN